MLLGPCSLLFGPCFLSIGEASQAALQEAIAQKRREIEQQVAEEKALLEAKVQELQMEWCLGRHRHGCEVR